MPSRVDPYRLLFPLGCVFAIWGAAVWLSFAAGRGVYPGGLHADLMIGGFLLTFALGFLMTAVPRFTDTDPATRVETGAAVAIVAFIAASQMGLVGEAWRAGLVHLGVALGLGLLLLFGGRRFVKRRSDPPRPFLFVGAGLACGFLGAALLAVTDAFGGGTNAVLLGRGLLFHGMMPCLVIGIGSRLLPALMGHGPAPVQLQQNPVSLRTIGLILAPFLLSFPVELVSLPVGRSLRAAVATFVAVRFWKLLQRPPRKGVQPFVLWLSAWTFLLGLWGYALLPGYGVHAVHLTFIGGLGLLTLLIATRVTLSHGGHGLSLEQASRALAATSVLALASMLGRVFAIQAGARYFQHLAYAAALWIAAVLVWSWLFVPKMVRTSNGR